MKLAEFLLARIAEDEKYAAGGQHFASWNRSWDAAQMRDLAVDGVRTAALPMALDEHVCRWDPARVLAECEAKRRIVGEHSPIGPGVNINTSGYAPKDGPVCGCCGEPEWGCVAWPCLTLRALALPFADHPDFDPTWRIS